MSGPAGSPQRRTAVALGAAAALGLVAFVLVWFQPQALLFDREVREALPGVASPGAADTGDPMPDGMGGSPMADGTAPAGGGGGTVGVSPEAASASAGPAPAPAVLRSGTFMDRSHPTSGTAAVYDLAGGTRVLRLEDLRTDNGPDLLVYLSAAPADAPAGDLDDDAVDLGRLKGNRGDQNYDIPPGTDLDHYRTVVIWCRRFGVAFGVATLTAPTPPPPS